MHWTDKKMRRITILKPLPPTVCKLLLHLPSSQVYTAPVAAAAAAADGDDAVLCDV